MSRDRRFFAMVKSKGRQLYDCSGDGVQWPVRYIRNTPTVNDGEQSVEFSRFNRHTTAYLDYVGLTLAESMTKREKLKNRGKEAIVKFSTELGEMMTEDLTDRFAEEIYVDSSATGNSGRWSGLETMMAATQTVQINSGAARTANAADIVGYPNDTYATISTVLGNSGGSWGTQADISSTWPMGRGSTEYDFWSPVICNYTSTALAGSAATWAVQCESATRFLIHAINGRIGAKQGVDLVLLDRELYRKFLEKQQARQTVTIQNSYMNKLGFSDAFTLDGVDITTEYGVPSAVGYALTCSNVEIRSMQKQLFNMDDPDWDPATRSWRFVADCLGQFKFKSPRHFGKLVTLA